MPKSSQLKLTEKKLTNDELRNILQDCIEETDVRKKGQKFEVFFENFMTQQTGFEFISKHCRSKVGEIDYLYRNHHKDHPLWTSYDYIFIECKNWKNKIGSKELDHFIMLLKGKKPFKCCGIYLSTISLSPEAHTAIDLSRRTENIVIFALEKSAMNRLVEDGFKKYLESACDKLITKA